MLSGPPFTGARAYHEVTPYEGNFGIPGVTMWASSASSTGPTDGVIHNSGTVVSVVLGLNGQEVTDGILGDFTVPSTGYYTVSFAGTVQGVMSTVGLDVIAGKTKGIFQSWMEAHVLEGTQRVYYEFGQTDTLYQSDVSLLTAIEETLWDVILVLAKDVGGDVAKAARLSHWVTDAAKAVGDGFQAFSKPLSMSVFAFLESGTTYTWQLATHSNIAEAAIGIAGGISTANIDVQLTNVSITPYGTPTAVTLGAIASPNADLRPGSPVTVSGELRYDTGDLVAAGLVVVDTGDNQYTASVKNGAFSQIVNTPSTSRNINVTAYESKHGFSAAAQLYLGVKNDESDVGYQIDDIAVIWDKVVTGDHLDQYSSKTAFAAQDPYVETLVYLTNVDRALTLRWEYFKPDGSLFQYPLYYQVPSPQSQGYDQWDWYWASGLSS